MTTSHPRRGLHRHRGTGPSNTSSNGGSTERSGSEQHEAEHRFCQQCISDLSRGALPASSFRSTTKQAWHLAHHLFDAMREPQAGSVLLPLHQARLQQRPLDRGGGAASSRPSMTTPSCCRGQRHRCLQDGGVCRCCAEDERREQEDARVSV